MSAIDSLEGVGDHVRDGSLGGVADAQRNHGDNGSAFDESRPDVIVRDVQDGRMVQGPVVVHHLGDKYIEVLLKSMVELLTIPIWLQT